eukprot:Tbor_TRINITY_DN5945_c2_g8::TRINITY_DN5945_c2_g8_i1::g.18901::m.18901
MADEEWEKDNGFFSAADLISSGPSSRKIKRALAEEAGIITRSHDLLEERTAEEKEQSTLEGKQKIRDIIRRNAGLSGPGKGSSAAVIKSRNNRKMNKSNKARVEEKYERKQARKDDARKLVDKDFRRKKLEEERRMPKKDKEVDTSIPSVSFQLRRKHPKNLFKRK